MIEVSLLGPPRVERDGVRVGFDTRKALALLAHLALTDHPRPRDALADLLWPDSDADHARGALRRTLSTLRGAIGADLVEATRDQVRLVKGPGLSVDVDEFLQRREAGDLEGAVRTFRGRPLEGFTVRDAPDFEDLLEAEAERLRRLLASTLAELAARREDAGDTSGAVEAVRRWLALDPLHEPAHQALMRLHAAAGDRAAALVQYRDCVRVLSRELGVSPLDETTELYDAINRGVFVAPAPQPARAADPPVAPAPAFVGRSNDLDRLLAVHSGIGEDGRVVLVEGEAGIGKTRLVDEALARIREAGATVVTARGYEDETGLAYRPVVDLLRSHADSAAGWLTELDDRVLAEVARLVPELTGRRLPPPAPLDQPGAEGRFLGALWQAMAAAAAGPVPGVLVLDDAQWADESTLRWLSSGVRRLAGQPLLVVVVWRTPDEHPARAALTRGARGNGEVLTLRRLDEDSVGTMIRSVHPDAVDAGVVHRFWETTEGVPLLLVEYLRASDGDALPRGAQDALRARLDPISQTGRQILSAASVLGRSFDVDVVRAVSGRTDEETVTALEELVRRGVIREREADYDFDHELLRRVVYADTSLARRRLLHGRAAAAVTSPLAAVARHHQLAGHDAAAASAYQRAGQQAREVFANDEALAHFSAALQLGHPDRAGLLVSASEVQVALGDYSSALASLQEAAAISEPDQLPVIEHELGRLQHRRGEYTLAEAHFEAALAGVDRSDLAVPAAIVADLSLAASSWGDVERALSLAQDAAEMAEQSGAPRALCQANNLLGMFAVAQDRLDDALEHLENGRSLAEQQGDDDLLVAALNNLALAHRARGDLPQAESLTSSALALCTSMGDRHREAALHNNLADLLQAMGRGEEAMDHLKSAVAIFAEVDDELQQEIWKLVSW